MSLRAPPPLLTAGRTVYAASVAALGAMMVTGTLVNVWAPLGAWVPARNALTHAYGAALLFVAAALLVRKAAARAAAGCAALFFAWLLLLQIPRIAGAPSTELLWSGAAQILAVAAGGAVACAALSGNVHVLKGARIAYAVALPVFGLHHLLQPAGAAEAVPAWLPFRMGWAYLTGVAHAAAGAGILLEIKPRLAARLEATMISGFVLLVHVPGVLAAPRDGLQWSMLVVAAAIGGAAWVVAGSFDRAK